jgi:carbon-monoxide dehydrogenase large subunit
LIDIAKERAATALEASAADLKFNVERSAFEVAGDPDAAVRLTELAATERLFVRTVFTAPDATFPFGTHVAVAEVDTQTGKATLRNVITVDDAGIVLNPLLAEGQRHGGIAQGAAQALCEEVVYDADGNPLTASFADYPIVSATELPSFDLATMETPTSYNPLGAKGIGEAGTIGSTPAVQSAIVDAVAHLGVRHVEMPTTPMRIWRAIQAAKAEKSNTHQGESSAGASNAAGSESA